MKYVHTSTLNVEVSSKPTILEVNQDCFRLIPSRFPPVDLYERFGSVELAEAAKKIDSRTNPRLEYLKRAGIPASEAEQRSPRYQSWNLAPFAYPNPEGTFLTPPFIGVMELQTTKRDAIAVAILRREEFLSRTSEPPLDLDMRALSLHLSGGFVDLGNSMAQDSPHNRWEKGKYIAEMPDVAGAVFFHPIAKSVRTLALLNQDFIKHLSVQGAHFRFVWDGKKIRSVYDFADGKEIRRSELFD